MIGVNILAVRRLAIVTTLVLAASGLRPVAAAEAVWVPDDAREAAPKLSLRDLDGQKQRLSHMKGSIVVVNFWATWCGPCRLEMPAFTKVYAAYRERGVEFVGAANETRQARDEVREFVQSLAIDFPIWMEASLDHMEDFGVGPSLPATVVVDPQGRIAARIQGTTDEAGLRSILDRLLSETSAAGTAPAH